MEGTIALILGVALIGLWVAFLFESRNEMNRNEYLSTAFVFQWNVLPFIVALELLATHNLMVLAVGLLVFFICWPFAKFLILIAPVASGWHVGLKWCSKLFANSETQVLLGALVVAIAVTLVCQAVVAAVRIPPRHA